MYFQSKEEDAYSFYIVDEDRKGYKKSISLTECEAAKKDVFVQFDTFQEGVDVVNINYEWIECHLEPLPKEEVLSKLHQNYEYVGYRPYCGRIEVRQNNLSGFVDIFGNEVIPIKYKSVLPFVKEMSIVSLSEGKYGLIDVNGKEIIPCKYDNVTIFESGFARIEKGNYWAVVDENLNIIIPFNQEYQCIENFKYGLAIAKKGTKWGVVNTHGDVIVPFKYYEIENFKKGIARVRLKSRLYGYINTEGEEIILPIYEYIGLFEKDVAVFWEGKKRGLIDRTSTIVAEAIYDEISGFFIDNNLIVRIDKKYGIISNTGRIVLPVQFEDLKILISTYNTLKESGLDVHNFSMN
ncbi:MAG TPA: WG repeat-containing protein [Bacteroidales bacterium]|nr:WG repeat-containing protein [Bacteroidales bacterium]